jgi:calmodulin
MLDKDASGSLTVNELQDAFEQMHSGLTDADILTIMSDLDDNQTGQIDREEFVNFFGRMFAEQ